MVWLNGRALIWPADGDGLLISSCTSTRDKNHIVGSPLYPPPQ